MTALSLGDQHIWVSRVNQPVKTPLRIRIASADVSLTLQPAKHSSVRNVLPAQVVELIEVGDQVEVKLRIGISELWARISPWPGTNLTFARSSGCTHRLKASLSHRNDPLKPYSPGQ